LEAIEFVDKMLPTVANLEVVKVLKRISSSERAQSWVVDYSAARARALEWLGDRYLLAKPVNAGENGWRKWPRTPVGPRERAS
jgi:hypothetical protein